MKHLLFLFSLFHLFAQGFAETELDSLESTGQKSSTSSPWRTQINFNLQRNTLLNSSYVNTDGKDQRWLDPNQKNSLLDFSVFFYSLSVNVNYSLNKYSFLKKMEFFVISSFSSPVTGYRNNEANYGAKDYVLYALKDIYLGLTSPVYRNQKFFSDFSLSIMPYPLSRFSRELTLITSLSGTFNLLYFLKRDENWNLALSSRHRLNLSEYKEDEAYKGLVINTPISTNQGLSLIYKQSFHKAIPSRTRLSVSHYLAKDAKGHYDQDLTFNLSSLWKIQDRLYLSASVLWKDRVHVFHPQKPEVKLNRSVDWFSKSKTVFRLGASYSF